MPTPAAPHPLVAEGWRLRYVDPPRLVEHAARLRAQPALAGWADLFEAWGRLFTDDRPGCNLALAAAQAAMEHSGDTEGRWAVSEMRAYLLSRDGRFDESLAAGAAAAALPEEALSPLLRFAVMNRHCTVLEQHGRIDDALQCHHEAIAAARRTGEPTLLATALGALGGLQSSLMNLEDALPLTDEAWTLCRTWQPVNTSSFVGPNHMMVLCGLQRHADAVAIAEELLAQEPRFPPRHRAQRHTLYGSVFADAGQLDRAQAMLDESRRLWPVDLAPRIEWAWTQARVWNRSGRPRDALALARVYIDARVPQRRDVDYPIDRANIHAEAATACEALGDFAEALHHEREAAQAREASTRQASHARRVTLQIALQLDNARRERDRALDEQQRLAAMNAALQSANQAKTRFLAAASHDLRQPIHALGLQLAALHEVLPPGGAQAIGQRMEATIGSLGSMFDLLLDLSRMDAGVLPVQRAEVDLRGLLVRLVDEFAPVAADRQLRLALRLPRACGTSTDALLLERAVRNLIDNALKYTERGGVLVALRAAGDGWRLQVWDTGRGIAPADQPRVFDEFYQVGVTARDRSLGLGLGLSIVRRLADLLGHRLELRSRPGRGSCFTLELPRCGIARPAPEGDPAAARWPAPTAGGCVAVIEDDAQVREAMRLLLERWGHRVVDGIDHRGVLAQCTDGARPIAVIADDQLPGAHDGPSEAAALGAALHCTLPTLIVTGDTSPHRVHALTSAGHAWLPKPVAPVRLRSWLAALAP